MNTFDDRLRGALSADDAEFLKNLEDDRGLFAQMGATFEGPLKYWTAFAFVLSVTFFGTMIWCAWLIWASESLNVIALATAGFIWSNIAVAMIKMWFWLRMNHLATLRELKKIELRIARIES